MKIRFMTLGQFALLLCWPWDHCLVGKYAAQNDNDWIYSGNHRTHRLDLWFFEKEK